MMICLRIVSSFVTVCAGTDAANARVSSTLETITLFPNKVIFEQSHDDGNFLSIRREIRFANARITRSQVEVLPVN